MNATAATVARRRLTQRGPALLLAIGLIAIPGVPSLANALLPEANWDTAEASEQVDIISRDGNRVLVIPPAGWEIQDHGDTATMRTDGSVVLVSIYDKSNRDPDRVAERLMRANRVQGVNTALDGGHVATADGSLSGNTCVAVSGRSTGTCAFLTDDDVIVSVLALGDPDHPAPPVSEIVAPITKGQS
jgi:hypothetical protein